MIRSFKVLAALSVAFAMLFGYAAIAGDTYELRDRLWSGTMNIVPAAAAALPDHELLRAVMAGGFDRDDDNSDNSLKWQTLASAMPQLAGVPQKELLQFADAYQLPEGVVRLAYFLALANTLRADISVNPASEGTYAELQKQLMNLLGHYDDEDEGSALHRQLTPEAAAGIAAGYGLPLEFVLFIAEHNMYEDINDIDDYDDDADDDADDDDTDDDAGDDNTDDDADDDNTDDDADGDTEDDND